MQGSPQVIDALNRAAECVHALHEQAHLQEHKFELQRWDFAKWFDKIETQTHECLFHYLLNRIGILGGTPSVAYAWAPVASLDIGSALADHLASMERVHEAYGLACDAAEDADDYVTEKMIWCHLERLEKWQTKFEARLAKYQRLGPVAFMAEYV